LESTIITTPTGVARQHNQDINIESKQQKEKDGFASGEGETTNGKVLAAPAESVGSVAKRKGSHRHATPFLKSNIL
jgi:hypothetical protein